MSSVKLTTSLFLTTRDPDCVLHTLNLSLKDTLGPIRVVGVLCKTETYLSMGRIGVTSRQGTLDLSLCRPTVRVTWTSTPFRHFVSPTLIGPFVNSQT